MNFSHPVCNIKRIWSRQKQTVNHLIPSASFPCYELTSPRARRQYVGYFRNCKLLYYDRDREHGESHGTLITCILYSQRLEAAARRICFMLPWACDNIVAGQTVKLLSHLYCIHLQCIVCTLCCKHRPRTNRKREGNKTNNGLVRTWKKKERKRSSSTRMCSDSFFFLFFFSLLFLQLVAALVLSSSSSSSSKYVSLLETQTRTCNNIPQGPIFCVRSFLTLQFQSGRRHANFSKVADRKVDLSPTHNLAYAMYW